MKGFIVFFVFLVVVLATSCISYRYIDIQVLGTGTTKLPSGVTLHLIEPQEIGDRASISVKDASFNKKYIYNILIHSFDSVLRKHFEESPYFDKSKIVVQSEKAYLDELKSKTIFEQKSNILLSFKNLTVFEFPMINIQEEDAFFNYYYTQKKYSYGLQIEIMNSATDQIYGTYKDKDTLIWTMPTPDILYGENKFPNVLQAASEVGMAAAEKYANEIAPVWETEERMLYYNGNKYMRHGYQKFTDNDIEGAITDWKHLYEIGTPALASIAAHNIALTYEMQDDLENCKVWLIYSLSNKKRVLTEDYLKRILERQAEREKTDKQKQ